MITLLSYIGGDKFAVYPASEISKDQICYSTDVPPHTLNVFSLSDDVDSPIKANSIDVTPIKIKESLLNPPNTLILNPEVIDDLPPDDPYPRCMEWMGGSLISLGIGPAVHIFDTNGEVAPEDYDKRKKFLFGGKMHVPVSRRGENALYYKEVNRHSSHEDRVLDISHNKERKLLASASKDCVIKIWDAESARLCVNYKYHSSQVNAVCWNPVLHNLLLSGSNKEVSLVDHRISRAPSTWVTKSSVTNLVWNPKDGHQCMINCEDGVASIYDTRTEVGVVDKVDDSDISVVCYHPTRENVFVTGSTTGMVKMWESCHQSSELKLLTEKVCCLEFFPRSGNNVALAYGLENHAFGIIS